MHAAHEARPQVRTGREHALDLHVRRNADNVVVGFKPALEIRPVGNAGDRLSDRRMRTHAQQPRAKFGLETVHDRQDDDQRGDSKRDTEQRCRTHERHDPAAPTRAQIAQADEAFQRLEHGSGLNHTLHAGRERIPIHTNELGAQLRPSAPLFSPRRAPAAHAPRRPPSDPGSTTVLSIVDFVGLGSCNGPELARACTSDYRCLRARTVRRLESALCSVRCPSTTPTHDFCTYIKLSASMATGEHIVLTIQRVTEDIEHPPKRQVLEGASDRQQACDLDF